MFCQNCGAQIKEGTKFCTSCGAPLQPAAPPTTTPPQGAAGMPAAPVPAPASASQPPAPKPQAPAPRRHSRALVVIIVALVVFLAAGGVVVWSLFFSPLEIDDKNFPDLALRAEVASTYDANHDGVLSRDEGRAVTEVVLSGATSLSGLGRAFPNVTSLTVTGGQLSQLDVSDLPGLVALDVADEPLAQLDVSSNPKLAELSVSDSMQVTGLEATTLHETWIATSVTEGWEGDPVTTYSVEHDRQGRMLARRTVSSDYSCSYEYAYDDQGLLAEETGTLNLATTSSYTRTLSYDERDNLISSVSLEGGIGYHFSYDEQGRLVESRRGSTNDTSGVVTYAYDDAGRLSTKEESLSSGLLSVTSYVYDGQGELVQMLQTYPGDKGSDNVTYLTTYVRDDAGNVVRVEYTSSREGGESYYAPVDFAYDDQNRMVSATATLQGATYAATLSYDARGNLSEVQESYKGKVTSTYTLSYERFFVAEGAEEPSGSVVVSVEYAPLVGAQRTALVGVWAAPAILPDPSPNALPGDTMIVLW